MCINFLFDSGELGDTKSVRVCKHVWIRRWDCRGPPGGSSFLKIHVFSTGTGLDQITFLVAY